MVVDINLKLMSSLLYEYEDLEIIEWLSFGFLISWDDMCQIHNQQATITLGQLCILKQLTDILYGWELQWVLSKYFNF